MKILIYTDLHCSYTSSILPLYPKNDDCSDWRKKFTTRLRMIIDTGRWIASLAERENVDMLINGGDTFDSTTVRSEELEAISQFFSSFWNLKIPHIILVGNHEKVNDQFNASEMLSKFSKHIQVYSEPSRINDYVSVLPYMDSSKISSEVLNPIKNKLLVSHIDIQGSCLRDSYILDAGVNPELLAEYFKFVANGHLHTAEKLETSQNKVWNIGGVSSISFVDNQNYVPSVVIYDTDTNSFERFENPHAILFRRITIHSLKDLAVELKKLDILHDYVLAVKYTNYEQKDDICRLLDKQKNIIAYKCVNAFTQTATDDSQKSLNKDLENLKVQDQFIQFLDSIDLKYDKADYIRILQEVLRT